jgi:hypothetical protein
MLLLHVFGFPLRQELSRHRREFVLPLSMADFPEQASHRGHRMMQSHFYLCSRTGTGTYGVNPRSPATIRSGDPLARRRGGQENVDNTIHFAPGMRNRNIHSGGLWDYQSSVLPTPPASPRRSTKRQRVATRSVGAPFCLVEVSRILVTAFDSPPDVYNLKC